MASICNHFRRTAGTAAAIVAFCSVLMAADREVSFTVRSSSAGRQFVRTSLPCPPGFLTREASVLAVTCDDETRAAGTRVISWYPANSRDPVQETESRSVRRLLVSFPWEFRADESKTFRLSSAEYEPSSTDEILEELPVRIMRDGSRLIAAWSSGKTLTLTPIVPNRQSQDPPREEIVEQNGMYRWVKYHYEDGAWPYVIELRSSRAAEVVCILHLQRAAADDGFAPEIGWQVTGSAAQPLSGSARFSKTAEVASVVGNSHSYAGGESVVCHWNELLDIYHPAAPLMRRGLSSLETDEHSGDTYRFVRCRAEDHVPMQSMAWRRAEIVIAPCDTASLTGTLRSPHEIQISGPVWQQLYGAVVAETKLPEVLTPLLEYHRNAVLQSSAVGDDAGNVTSFQHKQRTGGLFGMNRLNHCAAIFEDGWRHGDSRLTETALQWCDNFYDLSIWWGEPQRGGTRYNNLTGIGKSPPTKDFMWRSNSAVHFCTKGYDSFWLAWEETGDPRMLQAFQSQIAYAAEYVHADQGECRNVGDVRDFVRLYRFTGGQHYLHEALRLFRELRTKLSPDHLFDQGGKPIDPDPPFIDNDELGLKIGYAKPYIIGYALSGLPELLRHAPKEPELRETVRAVADFMAESADPSGGWRYPHPRSGHTLISFGPEPAWQLCQAARVLGPDPKWLDAIELVLRARLHGFRRTGTILSGIEAWEVTTGKLKAGQSLQDLYRKPGDRDLSRDYDEGRVSIGSSPPEGIVYLPEVLAFYLEHRSPERLLAEPLPGDPLARVLSRIPAMEQR